MSTAVEYNRDMSMRRVPLVGAALAGLVACSDPPPGDSYYDHFIAPVLIQNCASNVSGCHKANEGDAAQFAAGNFDVTSFENVQKRRDLLQTFGAYTYPALLIKAAAPTTIASNDPNALTVNYNGGLLDLEIAHSGQGVLEVNSDAFGLLLEWTQNGATINGLLAPNPAQEGEGPCSHDLLGFTDQQVSTAMGEPTFGQFRNDVLPILQRKGCGSATCHGAPQADFYVTCGDNDREVAFNYSQVHKLVAPTADQSQILFVPLAQAGGGPGHTGGDQFEDRSDDDYEKISAWAQAAGPVTFGGDAGKDFFRDHVQPIFIQRGCSFMNCHSPGGTNDFKLRAGSPGFFSSIAMQKNYDLLKHEFMALEYPDARRGRVVSKNILPDAGGIRHRGGPVLETPGRAVDSVPCPATFDPTFSPYCTLQEWVNIERAALGGQVDPLTPGTSSVDIIYVDRPGGGFATSPVEFDAHQPNSNLMRATAPITATGALGPAGGGTSILGSCSGFNAAQADVRAPDVAPDGNRVAFAMRLGPADPLGIWVVNLSTGACNRITPAAPDVGGIKIHNFDPVWSPDGQFIVFASTRGASAPSRSRRLFLPQSDIWRMRADGSQPEQITFLGNSEIGPGFMREGRISMTTEKTYVDDKANQGPGVFYQLSGRRINWDKTDYHPLLAQRALSPYADLGDFGVRNPSVNYQQATDIRERSNGDFLVILSDFGANGGGGALAIFNRSAGTFEDGRGEAEAAFLESMIVVDKGSNPGRLGSTEAYRSPYGLPDGQILASFASVGNLDNANNIDWDIVSVDVATQRPYQGTRTTIIGGAGAQMDAVLAIKRPPTNLFYNRRQLVFGGGAAGHSTAYVHFPDAPMVFTLLTGNLRRGHPVETFRAARKIEFFEEALNPGSSGNTPEGIFQTRNRLGAVDLAEDSSAIVEVPSGRGVVMRLLAGDGSVVVSMGEEHQFAAGEEISLGIAEHLFDAACGGCHGSVSGSELDNAVTPDVLTGASASMSHYNSPAQPR